MLGCLKNIGCLVLVGALGLGAYITQHRWRPLVTPAGRDAVAELPWAPLTAQGADRARAAVTRLTRADGPVYVNIAPADFAALLLDSLVQGIASGERPTEVALRDDRIVLRSEIRVSDVGPELVALIGGVADRRAPLLIGGRLVVDRPGLGELVVDELVIDAVSVPGPAVPRLTRALAQRLRRAGLRDDALGFALPGPIADLRVRGGMITLYKAVPE